MHAGVTENCMVVSKSILCHEYIAEIFFKCVSTSVCGEIIRNLIKCRYGIYFSDTYNEC